VGNLQRKHPGIGLGPSATCRRGSMPAAEPIVVRARADTFQAIETASATVFLRRQRQAHLPAKTPRPAASRKPRTFTRTYSTSPPSARIASARSCAPPQMMTATGPAASAFFTIAASRRATAAAGARQLTAQCPAVARPVPGSCPKRLRSERPGAVGPRVGAIGGRRATILVPSADYAPLGSFRSELAGYNGVMV
jgi:hypothetical protein